MRSSRTWPWVVGAAVAGIAVGLLLGRTGQGTSNRPGRASSDSRSVRTSIASVATPSANRRTEPPPSPPRGPETGPAAIAPALAVPVDAASTSVTPPPPDEWEKIPIDRAFGESLGSIHTRQAFSKGMRHPDTFIPCVKQWRAPPQLDKVELETELRVRSEEGVLVVEDAVVLEGNVADADLEACVVEGYRGRRIPVTGMEPGRRFRLKWGGVVALR